MATHPELLPTSFGPEDEFQFPQTETYVGTDAAPNMVKYFTEAANRIHNKLFPPPPLEMTEEDVARYEAEDQCHICLNKNIELAHIQHAHRPDDDTSKCEDCKINAKLEKMTFTGDRPIHHVHRKGQEGGEADTDYSSDCADCMYNARVKVRDHCHVNGSFRSAAHSICNLQYSIKKWSWKLPVFIHNLTGYDAHLILKSLAKNINEEISLEEETTGGSNGNDNGIDGEKYESFPTTCKNLWQSGWDACSFWTLCNLQKAASQNW